MKSVRIVVCLAAVLAITATIHAEDFNLTGNDELDVITEYENGYLSDFSSADIYEGGYIVNAFVNNAATLNVLEYKFGVTGINVGTAYSYDTSTVNVSNGRVRWFNTYDNSTANISGGTIDNIYTHNNSIANISNGTIGDLFTRNDSTVNIHGSIISRVEAEYNSTINIFNGGLTNLVADNDSTVNISGGVLTRLYTNENSEINISNGILGMITTYNNSTVEFSGGSVTKSFSVQDSSTLNITGGVLHNLYPRNHSIVNISGGTVDWFEAHDSGTTILSGYDFELSKGLSWDVDGQTILGSGLLTGKWFDDTSFTLSVVIHDPTATIMAIPEPATLLLLGLGGLVLRKRK